MKKHANLVMTVCLLVIIVVYSMITADDRANNEAAQQATAEQLTEEVTAETAGESPALAESGVSEPELPQTTGSSAGNVKILILAVALMVFAMVSNGKSWKQILGSRPGDKGQPDPQERDK